MTTEEAINALKMMNLSGVHPFLHWEEMMEVRDMAISALLAQQELESNLKELESNDQLNGWINVKDRLPEEFAPVIVCRKGGKVESGMLDVNGWWKVYGTRTKNVTHWMPMPEPPEVE